MKLNYKLFLVQRNKGFLKLSLENLDDLADKVNKSMPAQHIVSVETLMNGNRLAGLRIWYRA